jgi:hypothetical protein
VDILFCERCAQVGTVAVLSWIRDKWTMRIRWFSFALPLGAMLLSGCGLITKTFDGNAMFSFTINSMMATYNKIELFNPNTNEDVRNNRDRIKAGEIISINLSIGDIKPANGAKYVGGQIDVKLSTEPDSAYITAAGKWDGIPLYDDTGNPAIGQIINLDLPSATITALKTRVFDSVKSDSSTSCLPACDPAMRGADGSAGSACPKSCLDFRINGMGYDYSINNGNYQQTPTGPVELSGDVIVKLHVTGSG